MAKAENKAASGDRPQDKRGGLVQVVDRAVLQRKAALGHGDGVQHECDGEQAVVDPVVPLETAPPKEGGVQHAGAVNNDGGQKPLACRIQNSVRLGQAPQGRAV